MLIIRPGNIYTDVQPSDGRLFLDIDITARQEFIQYVSHAGEYKRHTKLDSVKVLDLGFICFGRARKRTKPNTYLGLGATQHLFRPEVLLVLLKRRLNTFGGDVNDPLTLPN